MKIKYISFSLVIIVVGILFSLFLQGQIADGVYFSGDGGLKALLAQQLAEGKFRFDLIPPQEVWIQNLWRDGLYPYQEPFVYDVDNKYYITFPYTFPLVTAPFYALFGYRGLYLIPLVSTWIIWFNFAWVCRQLKLNDLITSLGLFALIFTSYLTIYSAMYWEHTLAVALSFTGMSIFLIKSYPQGISVKNALISGCLIGLSVWFRPEFLCLVGLLTSLVILATLTVLFKEKVTFLKEINYLSQHKIFFLGSMFLTVGTFFVTNKLIYNHALGIHGIQAVEKVAFQEKLLGAWQNFQGLSLALADYLPIIYLPLLYLVIYLLQKCRTNIYLRAILISGTVILLITGLGFLFITGQVGTIKNVVKGLFPQLVLGLISIYLLKDVKIKFNLQLTIAYLFCLGFIVGVALLVPVGTAGLIAGGKQWGPRFLMILTPIITLITAIALNNFINYSQGLTKYSIFVLLGILMIWGIHQNIYQATLVLQKNNQATAAAVDFLQKDSHKFVAISHQFVGQALEPAVNGNKIFFRVDEQANLIKLGQALTTKQQREFIYICYPNRACDLPKLNPENLFFNQDNNQYKLQFLDLVKFGKYPIYQVEIDLIN
ncbi:dolichol-phosphate mannosyltransferase [Stanieria sp. NIES-3757]|nr:dolichol-phosphate mannosyltransferase [Stanieria sp. NIES-3757]